MPNLYANLAEVRAVAPNSITAAVTGYDKLFVSLAERISRWIDDHCVRTFYPQLETRYFPGNGKPDIYLGDLVSVSEVAYSDDNGANYTALSESDYLLMSGNSYQTPGSYNRIHLAVDGALSWFPTGQKAIKVTGIWAYTLARADMFYSSTDTVENNPLAADGLAITVNDADGIDAFGNSPRFSRGQLLRIESEWVEVADVNTSTNVITVARGRNGTTAAAHAQNTPIDIFSPPPPVKQALIIQAIHQFKRGQAAYGDAEALPDQGKIMHIKSIDPEVYDLLGKDPGEKYVSMGLRW